ncbi:Sec-dependent nitrous-oxide reductase [Bdellovibrio sp.]|uniref:Sec-dependent nitrous-oxide reductase n=1 Tax=Bdellovibrio sp. TaxID=28201 RepID=UPI0039E586A7
MKINNNTMVTIGIGIGLAASLFACTPKKSSNSGGAAISKNAAEKVYVAPGKHDEFYAFLSGGFSGQLAVYGLPSGRLLRVIPVYSVNPENGYGFTEETKKMLNTSHGFVPWDDSHHPQLSLTDGKVDGRYAYINANNTPRIAKIDLKTFKTTEIIEVPNSGGNHGSPYLTENTEYLIASTRFSIPLPNKDVALDKMKEEVKGTISFIKFGKDEKMEVAFQLLVPGIDYDLASCGKGMSHGYCFLTSYNSEKASTLIEINASKNDKDLLAIVNWKKAEECVAAGKAKTVDGRHVHNELNESTHTVTSATIDKVKMLDVRDCEGALYYAPVAKSPHGADVDPSGQYIIAGGKLAAQITAYDFNKIVKAIQDKKFTGDYDGVKVLDYESVLAGEVKKPCLGPLHTEFDGKGNAYTSCFVSSEVVKWKLGTWEVVDRMPTYYSLGHIMIPGSGSKQPWGKYLLAMNKITKDRYLPVGPELPQSAQLIDISGEKMEMLLDFPTVGEPHYAVALEANLIKDKVKKIYTLEENKHPFVAKSEKEARVVREGNVVHVYGTAIRSHFMPDNIEGIKVGDTVYFHITNLEQDWDIAHGFSIIGANTSELLLMPGETNTFKWEPSKPGVYPFYCTDFCSALHQEMQGYIRVSAGGSSTPLKFNQGK